MTAMVHKLFAGNGWTDLWVSTGCSSAAATPGSWSGRGVQALGVTGVVTHSQMLNLFGMGIHPDAEVLIAEHIASGMTGWAAASLARLGAKFLVYEGGPQWRSSLRNAYAAFNNANGVPSKAPILDSDQLTIRADVAAVMFWNEFGVPLQRDQQAAYLAAVTVPRSNAVAGFDVTFTPAPALSTLWATAPAQVVKRIEDAHHQAVARTCSWMETEVGFTRVGPAGQAQVNIVGLVMTSFTHRDSPAGTPNLHSHVVISNKVQTGDGRWLALDAKVLFQRRAEITEHYDSEMAGL